MLSAELIARPNGHRLTAIRIDDMLVRSKPEDRKVTGLRRLNGHGFSAAPTSALAAAAQRIFSDGPGIYTHGCGARGPTRSSRERRFLAGWRYGSRPSEAGEDREN